MRKAFDCVEMKHRIQKRMLEDEKRFGVEEMQRRRREWLENSDDPLAIWWRSISEHQESAPPALVREDEREIQNPRNSAEP